MIHDRVVSDPKIMMGKPVVRGTRVTVELILRLLGQGHAVEAVLDAYPGLTPADIRAAHAFAAEYLASGRILAAE
jgi:uncharacterized protein (DUF433 family)